ncbi:MAG: phosphate acyltransferase PlsX [Anaerolineae bacterium]
MRIALDAMGGDLGPAVTVDGAVRAARELGVEVLLVGRKEKIQAELARHRTAGLTLPVVEARQVVEMEDKPAAAVRKKKDASIVVAMNLVKEGRADALVSVGNTGGVYAAALWHLGRIRGIRRAALSVVFPTVASPALLLDMGANMDCKPEYLLQFGIMGSVYTERVMGVESPRVGLISTGEEEGKGSTLAIETYDLLAASGLNFVGNLEGKDLPLGLADVVVTDGFTGNVIIKLAEGVGGLLVSALEEEVRRSPVTLVGGLLASSAFKRVRRRVDYTEYGGAALLGVDGVVIIGHGRSNAEAVKNALKVAVQAAERGVVGAIANGVAETLPLPGKATVPA